MRDDGRGADAAMALLLAATRAARPGGDATRVMRAAAQVEDWDAVLRLATRHRVLPFVFRHLDDNGGGGVSSSTLALLRGATLEVAANALASARELQRLLAAFDAAGVRALPYKGPALALVAYGDIGVRDFVDLDFVVSPDDLDRARDALVAIGYRQREGMSRAQEGAIYGGQGHFPYMCAGRLAELHWRFAATRFPWNPSLDAILARAGRAALAGTEIIVPSHQDHVLLLALHGTRHLWAELEWVAAITGLLRSAHVDAASLLSEASASGGRRALLVGLEVARRVLDAPVPVQLAAEATRDAAVEPLVRASIASLMHGSAATVLRRNHARAFYLRCLERPVDRVRFIAQSTLRPTPREWELMRLPGALSSLYVPLRLGRLLLRR